MARAEKGSPRILNIPSYMGGSDRPAWCCARCMHREIMSLNVIPLKLQKEAPHASARWAAGLEPALAKIKLAHATKAEADREDNEEDANDRESEHGE